MVEGNEQMSARIMRPTRCPAFGSLIFPPLVMVAMLYWRLWLGLIMLLFYNATNWVANGVL